MIKKALSIILTAVIFMSLTGTAFAEDGDFIDSKALDDWINQYLLDNGLTDANKEVSVGFVYTRTGDEYYYNADEFMYSASLYKVPVSMLLAEQEAAGQITQQSEINTMSVEYLEYTALVNSNNDSGHYIADYVGEGISQYDTYSGKDADIIRKYAPDIDDSYYQDDFYNLSYYTARFMTQVMKTLYNGGDAQYPHIIDYLKQAQPENYYNKTMAGMYEIAQKYGAYEEKTGTKDNHCAAIIYTPNPIIVVVMTKNVSSYENVISDIGLYLADYSLSLDEKPNPTPSPEPTPIPTQEIVETPEPTQTPVQEIQNSEDDKSFPFYVLLLIPVAAAATIMIKRTTKDEKNKKSLARTVKTENTDTETYQKGKYRPKH